MEIARIRLCLPARLCARASSVILAERRISRTSMHPLKSGRSKSSASAFDLCAMIPLLALAYSVIIQPLIYFYFPPAPGLEGLLESRAENRIFWPVLAAIAVAVAAQRWP